MEQGSALQFKREVLLLWKFSESEKIIQNRAAPPGTIFERGCADSGWALRIVLVTLIEPLRATDHQRAVDMV